MGEQTEVGDQPVVGRSLTRARSEPGARSDTGGRSEIDRSPEQVDVSDVAALCCAAFDGEHLLVEDIEALVRDEPGKSGDLAPEVLTKVFTMDDRSSVAIARVDRSGTFPVANLDVLATDAGHRRRGGARAVLDAVEGWARDLGAEWLEVGDRLPKGIFSGVDVRWTAAMCLFESRGYERVSVKVDLSCPTITSSPARLGAAMRAVRVTSDEQAKSLAGFVAATAPHHARAFATAAEWGTAVIVIDSDSGQIYGAGAHSLQRLGVIGPVTCRSGADEGIVISVLFKTLLGDLSTAGLKTAEIVGSSKMTPYVKAVGASAARVSLVLRRRLV